MKHILLASIALAAIPSIALSQNRSVVIQGGIANLQTTYQTGDGFAVTTQRGEGNNATTIQNGMRNLSVIHQVGANHTRTVVQTGDLNISSTTQVSSPNAQGFSFQSGGNGVIRGDVTIEFTLED